MEKIVQAGSIQSNIMQAKSISLNQSLHNASVNTTLEVSLEQQPHFFILFLGLITGSVIALAVGFALKVNLFNAILLMLVPIAICYLLRKVYIYTLLNYQE